MSALVWCMALAAAAAPVLSSLNVAQTDSAGGDTFLVATCSPAATLTGCQFSRDGGATWVGGTLGTLTATTAKLIPPAMAAASGLVRVFGPGGTSNTLAIEFWAPTDDANVTLGFDPQSSPYNAATGVWVPRKTAVAGAQLAMAPGSTANFASDGAGGVLMPGTGSGGAIGLQLSSQLTYFLGSAAGGMQPGSYAAVFSSQTTFSMSAASHTSGASYTAPGPINNASQGTTGLDAFVATENGAHRLAAHVYGAGGYNGLNVPMPADSTLHAVVSRWHTDATPGLEFNLSVDGALSGAGSATAANGVYATNYEYTAVPPLSGVAYPGSSSASQVFKGTIKALFILKARASDTFVTKFAKWKLARFGT